MANAEKEELEITLQSDSSTTSTDSDRVQLQKVRKELKRKLAPYTPKKRQK